MKWKRGRERERELDRFNQWFSKWKLRLTRWGLEIRVNEKALHSGRTLLQYFNVIFFSFSKKGNLKLQVLTATNWLHLFGVDSFPISL